MPPRHYPEDVLRQRFRALSRALPKALEGDVKAIHKARVASRRVREALPIALADARQKKRRTLQKRVERITRGLGPVRELDVSLGITDELVTTHPDAAAALAQLRVELHAERQEAHAKLREKLGAVDVKRLEARVERLLIETVDAAQPAAGLSGTAVLMVRLTQRVQELDEAVQAAGPLYAPDPIHAVRISAKKLRYALELTRDLQMLTSRSVLPRMRAMQETLGRLHDLQVLVARLNAQRAKLEVTSPQVQPLEIVITALEDECRELHARFVLRRDKLMQTVDAALTEIASRAGAVSESTARDLH